MASVGICTTCGGGVASEADLAALVEGAPAALDTLNELAGALGDDASFAATVTNSLAAKVAKTTLDANSLLYAVADDTPVALALGASTIPARLAAGNIVAASPAQVGVMLKAPVALFDHYVNAGNTGTDESDLYADQLTAGQLAANGDKINAGYGLGLVASATATRVIRVYFGGTAVATTSALVNVAGFKLTVDVTVVRVSSSVVRYRVVIDAMTGGAVGTVSVYEGEVTGLTLANAQTLKITGQAGAAGAATDDIVARSASVVYTPAS